MNGLSEALIARAVDFHGHKCPGLALGLRAAGWVLENPGSALDEEIVCVTETDMCAVDAIQALVGCTFGKGNLIYRDYGKVAFTFWRRCDGRAVRLVNVSRLMTRSESEESRALKALAFSGAPMTPEQKARHEALRAEMIERILNAPFEEVYRVEEVSDPHPHVPASWRASSVRAAARP